MRALIASRIDRLSALVCCLLGEYVLFEFNELNLSKSTEFSCNPINLCLYYRIRTNF